MFGISATKKEPAGSDLRFVASDGTPIVTFTGDGKIQVPAGVEPDYAAQQFLLAVKMATGRTLVIDGKDF